MSWLRISEVARQMRLRPSAIRYYEQLGILPKPERISGKRCYDRTVLYRLAVIQQAREAGFALQEIRTLFFGFQEGTRAEARWCRLADRKLAELDALAGQIRWMRTLLKRMKADCHCKTLEACGKAILENGISRVEGPSFRVTSKPR
jgi:MerR family transcriptional regulator, redox-sensitive transcriptional activator SoxR